MAAQGVSVEDSVLVLRDGDKEVRAPVDAVIRCFIASLSHPLHQGDEPFLIISFADSLWVIPQFTPGLDAVLHAVAARLPSEKLARAEVSKLPMGWRKRLLGLFPVFPVPRLGAYSAPKSPLWVTRGSLTADELKNAI